MIATPSGSHFVQNFQSLFKIGISVDFKLIGQCFQSTNNLMNLLKDTEGKEAVMITILTS